MKRTVIVLLAAPALSLWQWQSALSSRDELRDVHIPAAAKREADVREQLQQCQAARNAPQENSRHD